jgi:hypothetical protein
MRTFVSSIFSRSTLTPSRMPSICSFWSANPLRVSLLCWSIFEVSAAIDASRPAMSARSCPDCSWIMRSSASICSCSRSCAAADEGRIREPASATPAT